MKFFKFYFYNWERWGYYIFGFFCGFRPQHFFFFFFFFSKIEFFYNKIPTLKSPQIAAFYI
jgi:hypothetical protein